MFGKRRKGAPGEGHLGYWLELRCSALELDLAGSATQLLYDLEHTEHHFRNLIDRPDANLRATVLETSRPTLDMRGGPLLLAIMDLLVAIEKSDLDEANRVVEEHPILRETDDGNVLEPMFVAIETDDLPILRLLATNDIGLNFAVDHGMSALHWAAILGSTKAVSTMVEAGARVDLLNWYMLTPAELARANGRKDNMRVLAVPGRKVVKVDAAETVRRMCIFEADERGEPPT